MYGKISLIRGMLFSGIYTLFPPIDFNCVCRCLSRWLSRGNRLVCKHKHIQFGSLTTKTTGLCIAGEISYFMRWHHDTASNVSQAD